MDFQIQNPKLDLDDQSRDELFVLALSLLDGILPLGDGDRFDFSKRGISNLYLPFPYFLHLDEYVEAIYQVLDEMITKDLISSEYQRLSSKEARRSNGVYFTPSSFSEEIASQHLDTQGRILDIATGTASLLIPFLDMARLKERLAFGIEVNPFIAFLGKVNVIVSLHLNGHVFSQEAPIEIPIYNGEGLPDFSYKDNLFFNGVVFVSIPSSNASVAVPSACFSTIEAIDLVRSHFGSLHKTSFTDTLDAFEKKALKEEEERFNKEYEGEFRAWMRHKLADSLVPYFLNLNASSNGLLVSNPPWVPYRSLPFHAQSQLQRGLSHYGLWPKREIIAHRDTSLLFAVSSIDNYLPEDAKFILLLPYQLGGVGYEPFQRGLFSTFSIEFETLRQVLLNEALFPINSICLTGRKRLEPTSTSHMALFESLMGKKVAREVPSSRVYSKKSFNNGATLSPKALLMVEDGGEEGAWKIATRTREKPPWRDLPRRTWRIEEEFVYDVISAGDLLPFGLRGYSKAILPIHKGRLIPLSEISQYPLLANWWEATSKTWSELRDGDKKASDKWGKQDFLEQINHYGKLGKQLVKLDETEPFYRVVYSASGRTICAVVIDRRDVVIEHSSYWADFANKYEAHFLAGLLMSNVLSSYLPASLRHIDKSIFEVGVPRYSASSAEHCKIAELSMEAHRRFLEIEINEKFKFRSARDHVLSEMDDLLGAIDDIAMSLFAS